MSENGDMENPPAEMDGEQKAEETTPLNNDANETQDSRHRYITDEELCCCCICNCSEERTRNLSCFGCFPIKCGLVSTGILTVCLIVFSFTEIFYFILNILFRIFVFIFRNNRLTLF